MGNPPENVSFGLRFGAPEARAELAADGLELHLPVPALGARSRELVREVPGGRQRVAGPFHLLENEEQLVGAAWGEFGKELETRTQACYGQLFALLGPERHLYRVWHYIPQINDELDGLENYRAFNIGRARAFEETYGPRAESMMPAASAVGIPGQRFVLLFVAGKTRPRYVENPEQTPAYHYPESYGPKSPSFARAATFQNGVATHAFISGTASIKGHQTVGSGDARAQFETTANNLDLVAREIGLPNLAAVCHRPDYRLKLYLRHAETLRQIQALMRERLGSHDDNTVILQTEICRRDLDLEIEASFSF